MQNALGKLGCNLHTDNVLFACLFTAKLSSLAMVTWSKTSKLSTLLGHVLFMGIYVWNEKKKE